MKLKKNNLCLIWAMPYPHWWYLGVISRPFCPEICLRKRGRVRPVQGGKDPGSIRPFSQNELSRSDGSVAVFRHLQRFLPLPEHGPMDICSPSGISVHHKYLFPIDSTVHRLTVPQTVSATTQAASQDVVLYAVDTLTSKSRCGLLNTNSAYWPRSRAKL